MAEREKDPKVPAALTPRAAYVLARAPWLTPELLVGAGRDRLIEWARNGMPCARVEDVKVYGDDVAAPHVAHALSALPPPVLHRVATGCHVVVLGMKASGVHLGLPTGTLLVATGRTPHWIVRTAFHEIGHAWAESMRTGTMTVAGEMCLRALAEEDGWGATFDAHVTTHEDMADALAVQWLARYYGPDYARLFGENEEKKS